MGDAIEYFQKVNEELTKLDGKTIVTKQKINIDEITKQVEEKVKERLMRSTSQAWG